jgi:hypothetical protein
MESEGGGEKMAKRRRRTPTVQLPVRIKIFMTSICERERRD